MSWIEFPSAALLVAMRLLRSAIRSLVDRATLMYLAAVVVIALIIGTGMAFSETVASTSEMASALPQVKDNAATMISSQLQAGRSVQEALQYASDHIDRPDFVLEVTATHAFFNGNVDWSRTEAGINYLLYWIGSTVKGFPPFAMRKASIPDGFVAVEPNYLYVAHKIVESYTQVAPFVLLAMLFGYIVSRFIARYGTRPLCDIAAHFRTLADGHFDQRLTATTGVAEIRTFNGVYNTAIQSVQVAVADRERAGENIRSFIADAGHELKTPVTIIMGYLDAVVSGLVSDPQDAQRVLEKTLAECRRMRSTIAKLSTLAQLDRGATEIGSFDATTLTREVVDGLNAVTSNVHLDAGVEEDTLAYGDPDQIREAILNIIDNAVKYAPGSPIDIRVAQFTTDVMIEIADAGPGMSPHDRELAFNRFHRGTSAGNVEGSGLGLSIAKRAVERARGRIVLTSELGHGTAVRMYLPRITRDDHA